MPRYVYRCTKCEIQFEVTHSMSDTLEDCATCLSENTLRKVPQSSFLFKKRNSNTGKVVESHISKSKKELQDMKEKLRRKL